MDTGIFVGMGVGIGIDSGTTTSDDVDVDAEGEGEVGREIRRSFTSSEFRGLVVVITPSSEGSEGGL
jgi:hypothetical protein